MIAHTVFINFWTKREVYKNCKVEFFDYFVKITTDKEIIRTHPSNVIIIEKLDMEHRYDAVVED